MKPLDIVTKLCQLESRLGSTESAARDLIFNILTSAKIAYVNQTFTSQTPRFISWSLRADGKAVDCLPTGLKSGKITNAYNLISSLTSSQKFIDTPNINFNPKSDAICRCNFYFAPSFAISRRDVTKIMEAKTVEGSLEVEPESFTATNILIGNTSNPETIVFAHYDAYFSGATDNASGVACCLSLLLKEPSLLKKSLFVLAGNEELSYDYPIYWGRCFREFNRSNPDLLGKCKKILVVDSVGDDKPVVEDDLTLLSLAFPIGNQPEILAKTKVVTGNFDRLMTVYHSQIDNIECLSEQELAATQQLIEQQLKV